MHAGRGSSAAMKHLPASVVFLLPLLFRLSFSSGLGKIDCNRYSIAILFTFCSSNAL